MLIEIPKDVQKEQNEENKQSEQTQKDNLKRPSHQGEIGSPEKRSKSRKMSTPTKITKDAVEEKSKSPTKKSPNKVDSDNENASLSPNNYVTTIRQMIGDEEGRSIALNELAKFISKECSSACTEIARLSPSIDNLNIPQLRKCILKNCPNTIEFFGSLTGKEKLLTPALVSIISILMYALNSHANLFQKIVSALLLSSKCNPSAIEKLHSYKVCVAYETLVTFLDNKTESGQLPKIVKKFQFL